jgi:ATP-dependent RNA helicase DeaD
MTFEELGLESNLLKAVSELGFVNPTPIQEQTIAQLQSKSTDMVALAQTGTGKTAGFGLPMLSKLNFNDRNTQALILAPTRELCVQISKDLINYSKYISGLKITAVYGGAPIMGQIRDLKAGSQIVVATPGRFLISLKEEQSIFHMLISLY